MLYKVVLTFESVDKTLECYHLNESYWAVLFCGTVHYVVQGGPTFWVCALDHSSESQSWKVLSLSYHVSMSVACFVASFVCSLTCEPRAVYLRPGGEGGIHSWIHTLFNVIHTIKELKVSVKDVVQGWTSIRGLCKSHDFAKNFNQVAPKPSKHLEQATQQVVSEAPTWKLCEQLTGLGEKKKDKQQKQQTQVLKQ